MSRKHKIYEFPILIKPLNKGYGIEWQKVRGVKHIEIPGHGVSTAVVVHRNGFWSLVECWTGVPIENKKLQRELGSKFAIEQYQRLVEHQHVKTKWLQEYHNALMSLIPDGELYRIQPSICEYMLSSVWPGEYPADELAQ